MHPEQRVKPKFACPRCYEDRVGLLTAESRSIECERCLLHYLVSDEEMLAALRSDQKSRVSLEPYLISDFGANSTPQGSAPDPAVHHVRTTKNTASTPEAIDKASRARVEARLQVIHLFFPMLEASGATPTGVRQRILQVHDALAVRIPETRAVLGAIAWQQVLDALSRESLAGIAAWERILQAHAEPTVCGSRRLQESLQESSPHQSTAECNTDTRSESARVPAAKQTLQQLTSIGAPGQALAIPFPEGTRITLAVDSGVLTVTVTKVPFITNG